MAEGVRAAIGYFLGGDEPAEGRLARAVRADDGKFFALVDFEIKAVEDAASAVVLRGLVEFGHHVAGVWWRRKFEIHHRVVMLGRWDALDFCEHLDARLHERRLVGRCAEAIDEALDLGDFALLGFVLLAVGFLADHRLAFEVGKISRILLGPAVGEGDGARAKRVEQPAVVGNEQDRAGVVDEVLLDPHLRVDVEVVGRLVEQQNFGLLEEELRHRDAHLPTAGKLRAVAGEIGILEAEALEHRFDARLHAGGVGGIELQLERADFLKRLGVGRGTRVEFFELVGKAVDPVAQFEHFAEGGFRFLPQRAAADMDPFLRQVAVARALGRVDRAGARADDAGDALHQRRLASTVVTGEGNALAGLHGKGQVVEQHAGTKLHAQ